MSGRESCAYLVLSLITACGRIGFDPANELASDAATDLSWPTLDGQWTWIGGPNLGNQPGSYGTLRVPAATNLPGARDNGAAWAVGESLWLFGGYGFASSGEGRLGDLWQLDLRTGTWTWMHGATTIAVAGRYGTKGQPGAANTPGARNDMAAWVDSDGGLWLFGESGLDGASAQGNLHDVWRYDIATDTWTWVSGSSNADQPGVYGTLGVAGPANVPGGRSSTMLWAAGAGVWMFGGTGADRLGTKGRLSDLWRYDPASNLWTWIAGSDLADQPAAHGMLGVASGSNSPGGRTAGCTWTAPDELWLFGGSTTSGRHNDLWLYTISTGAWTWMAGSSGPSRPGVHAARGISAPTNVPGARLSHACWQDPRGNFWVFGGFGFDSAGSVGALYDLWVYMPSTGEWTWVSGGDRVEQVGHYGTLGTPDVANTPGSRMQGDVWSLADGTLWLFGGDSAHDATGPATALSDLWRFARP